MAIVTIPFDYDPLTSNGTLIPIFLNDTDDRGRQIYFGWIEAVVPVHDKLTTLARRVLHDAWRASELADVTIHHLWGKYGSDVGPNPSQRVYVTARRKAHSLEDPGARLHLRKNIALDSLADFQRDALIAITHDLDGALDYNAYSDLIQAKVRELGTAKESLVYQKVKAGYYWREIAEQLNEKPNTVHRRFKRLLQRVRDSL